MVFRSLIFFRNTKFLYKLQTCSSTNVYRHFASNISRIKEFNTGDKLMYPDDPDTFGTFSGYLDNSEFLQDEGDIKEENFLQNVPLRTQKLTTKQYADLIKQYLKHNRLKEAIDILEVRMKTEDRVKPENYIYNLLIGACANVGYTKMAFKLYNDMKRRALMPTGDTYTCLFNACANSPWHKDGLSHAHHLRKFMIEKNIEPNLTNYNSMIKAFGRCGDLSTAFKIVDEMVTKKIKIRVHTYNHLLQACISDKNTGLRHALVVWRKMLKAREKPNIYSFNLMLKCVKECNIGSKESIEELISFIKQQSLIENMVINVPRQIESSNLKIEDNATHHNDKSIVSDKVIPVDQINLDTNVSSNSNALTLIERDVSLQLVDKSIKLSKPVSRLVPNLLSKVLHMDEVMALKEVTTLQEKFTVIGGQDDFLKEMEVYNVKPDIKTFTQMLTVLDDNKEVEIRLIETMKSAGTHADIDFYNMLIKKRCLRSDYEGAMEVRKIIEVEKNYRKKRYPLKKKLRLRENITTYGVLAMACSNKDHAEKLIEEIKEKHLKFNIEILGTLLKQGTTSWQFSYVQYIMDIVKMENIKLNDVILNHLETFNNRCANILRQGGNNSKINKAEYKKFLQIYRNWLTEVNAEDSLQPEHPWKQFREEYPASYQRDNIKIIEPKRFYKRNRKYVPYAPTV